MGSPTALLYAAEHPDEVQALAYLEEPIFTKHHIEDSWI
jgi:pimeloyl-ACP methyl ester carboxylesterase